MNVEMEKFMGVYLWFVYIDKIPGRYSVVGRRSFRGSQIASHQIALVVGPRTLGLVLELLKVFFQEGNIQVST